MKRKSRRKISEEEEECTKNAKNKGKEGKN